LFAALLALASPLRAGEAAWLNSADHQHILQLPAAWASAAVVPGLSPKGIKNTFSLARSSRAFVLDIAAEDLLAEKHVEVQEYFTRARKLAGNPPAQRVQLADNSLFEYFRSTGAAKGRAAWRVQGVLHKYVQRYYITFSAPQGYPGDKDWKEALELLGTLADASPSVGGWKDDYLDKVAGGPGLGLNLAAAGENLDFAGASNPDGTDVNYNDLVIFGCKNFNGNLYLFNKDRTAHCWVVTLADYIAVLGKLGEKYWVEAGPPSFQVCPAAMRQEKACDMAKFRDF